MSQALLNIELLARMVKSKRGSKGLREISETKTGVSIATLSRVENGKIPDVETLIKICKWLELPMDYFVHKKDIRSEKTVSNRNTILAYIHSDNDLSDETKETVARIIHSLYEYEILKAKHV